MGSVGLIGWRNGAGPTGGVERGKAEGKGQKRWYTVHGFRITEKRKPEGARRLICGEGKVDLAIFLFIVGSRKCRAKHPAASRRSIF